MSLNKILKDECLAVWDKLAETGRKGKIYAYTELGIDRNSEQCQACYVDNLFEDTDDCESCPLANKWWGSNGLSFNHCSDRECADDGRFTGNATYYSLWLSAKTAEERSKYAALVRDNVAECWLDDLELPEVEIDAKAK